jgi:hypothetical protein
MIGGNILGEIFDAMMQRRVEATSSIQILEKFD